MLQYNSKHALAGNGETVILSLIRSMVWRDSDREALRLCHGTDKVIARYSYAKNNVYTMDNAA